MIAKNLQEVIRISNALPLTEKDFEQYYINCTQGRGVEDTIVRLCSLFRTSNTPQKILFTGHRGCGKTTELTRLIRELKDSFFIISFSAKEELDLNNLNFIDLVITMMTQVYKKAEEERIDIQPQLIEDINEWFSTIVKEYEESKGAGLEIEAGGGVSALNIFFSKLKGFLKTATTSKTLLRQTIEPKISELLERSNSLLREIKNCLDNREILIIVEDLDKLDKSIAKSLFFDHSKQLISLNSHIIYTIPISILYSTDSPVLIRDFDNSCEILPMIKVKDRYGKTDQKGIDLLREVVNKRMAMDMFEEKVLDEIINKSGGCLRDIFLFIKDSALSAISTDKKRLIWIQLKILSIE